MDVASLNQKIGFVDRLIRGSNSSYVLSCALLNLASLFVCSLYQRLQSSHTAISELNNYRA
jgi:hypothetical protein